MDIDTLIRRFLADPECNPMTGNTIKRHSRLFDQYIDLCKMSEMVEEFCRLFAAKPYKIRLTKVMCCEIL